MRLIIVATLSIALANASVLKWNAAAEPCPKVTDSAGQITYSGVYESGVEAYLGIQYGQDTGGQNRFKRPQAYKYPAGTTIMAQSTGPACPQPLGAVAFPVYLSNITEISEDCLLLNVKRPNGTTSSSKLPVMVFIHGGSLITSSKDELLVQPSGLILESISNGYPVMHVAMNYRLGVFGYAQSGALQAEGSLNAGMLDQRLALDWVKDNIAAFGGDPGKITIFGQSSGGLSVGLQIMAFGATKPVPFQQAICESQALEGGITGNFTREAMSRLADATGCNSTDLDSITTLSCLRDLPLQQLVDAQTDTHDSGAANNIGDEWLPVVDGYFLPEAPSRLVAEGKFANITTIIGWADGDADIIVSTDVRTSQDSDDFVRGYLPGFNESSINTLEALYPVSEFQANPAANLTAEFYRTSRIVRDIVFVCMAFLYGEAITAKGNQVYFYDQNQTFVNPALTSLGLPDLGVIHTSEFAYVFGNLSHYDVDGFPYLPNATDYALLQRESRSWSSFANFGTPSLPGKTTLAGWTPSYSDGYDITDIFVIGGPHEGLFADLGGANAALNGQQLQKRCSFLNSPDIIDQLNY